MPIALLIGAGSRIPLLLERLAKPDAPALITNVVSHKALLPDEEGKKTRDVIGIAEAKKYGISTCYFNLAQMREAVKKVKQSLDELKFREDYFRILGAYLCQNYPVRPAAVFMLGWDLVVSEEFLKFFPSENESLYSVINLHPGQLPDNRGEKTVKLPSGVKVPVLRGEHDEVLNEAIRLRLPVLGACMHFARPEADVGEYIIERIEVPIIYKDNDENTFNDYEERLRVAESELVADVVDKFAQGKISVEGRRVKVAT